MISSNRTGGPCLLEQRSGAASIAQASDAHDARMARFSLIVRSGSLITSDGWPKARSGCKSSSGSKLPRDLSFMSDLPPLKWSSLKYDFRMEDKINGKEEAYG
jgi:hypothetical protein